MAEIHETILIDGQDLREYVSCIESLDGLWLAGARRSDDNLVYPGMDGEVWVEKPLVAVTMNFGLTLHGDTTAEFNSNLRALTRLLRPGKVLNLERRMSYVSGNEIHVGTGEYVTGLSPALKFMRFGKLPLALRLFEGAWYSSVAVTEVLASDGSITVDSDLNTADVVVTMEPGSWLLNTTNGHRVENTAPVDDGPVTVDSKNIEATQGGLDVTYSLIWTHLFPMRLEPGVNEFTMSAGVTLQYRAAYL